MGTSCRNTIWSSRISINNIPSVASRGRSNRGTGEKGVCPVGLPWFSLSLRRSESVQNITSVFTAEILPRMFFSVRTGV